MTGRQRYCGQARRMAAVVLVCLLEPGHTGDHRDTQHGAAWSADYLD